MSKYYFIILLHSFFFCFSQQSILELNLKNLNYNLIESEFISHLNQLRNDKGLHLLINDNILKKAAKDQADYQLKKHFLTHGQTEKNKETPQNRVFYYEGTHSLVGENCIKIPLKSTFKPKYKKTEFEVKTYKDAGEALFLGWKNSPGHYKNMIDPDYEVTGIGFSFDSDSNYLYCAQVFALKPYYPSIEYQSPADAYGIKPFNQSVCTVFETLEGRKALKSFQLTLSNDSIFLRSEDLQSLAKFFNNANDGIYFDLVQRKQFVCEKNNLLHGSPLFDGKMLKPVLFKDILKRNRAKDGRNLYASICATPKQLKDAKVQINYGIFKNGVSCEYIYPIEVPNKNLDILALYPKWIFKENIEIKPDSFIGALSFTMPFERSETKLSEKRISQLKEKLEIYKPFITDLNLQTFSSIEGNTQINFKLQQERANTIIAILNQYSTLKVGLNKQESENWEEFFAMIENTPVDYLKKLPREKIKEKLKSKSLLDSLDYLLRKNRTALLTINLKVKIDNNSNPYLILGAYKKSIQEGDSLKAFIQQNKILDYISKYQFNRADLLPIEIPKTKKFLPHLTNYLAIAVKDDELIYSQEARSIAKSIYEIDTNYLPVKFNCCIMAIRYLHEFNDTIFPIAILEKNMLNCFKLNTSEDSVIVNHMLLNYNILSLYNNWLTHQYQKIDKHLLEVKKYYPGAHISEQEAIQLGLLFNNYARYDWTIDLLLPYIKNKTKNENMMFLFVQTYACFKKGILTELDWEKYLKKVKKMNKQRFYTWINEVNYQLLRQDLIKKEFCEITF